MNLVTVEWFREQPDPERSRRSRRSPTRTMPQPDYEFGSGTFVKLRRLAIRAAKFEPEADCATWTVSEIHYDGISVVEKNEGPLRGHQ
jgi:hypothetical protein